MQALDGQAFLAGSAPTRLLRRLVRGRYCVWRRFSLSRVLYACPSLDTRECKTGSLHKSAKAGGVTADDKGLHLDGALVGDQRLHIAEVPHHMEVKRDAVAAQDIAGLAADVARLDRAVIFREGRHGVGHFAFIDQATETNAVELHRGKVA